MCDMTIGKYHTVFTNFGRPAVARTAVYGDKFTNGSIVAYLNRRFFTVKFEILRIRRDNSSREDPAIFPNPGTLHNRHIASDPGPRSYFHIFMNHRKRIYLYVGRKPGIRVDGSIRVNHAMIN